MADSKCHCSRSVLEKPAATDCVHCSKPYMFLKIKWSEMSMGVK